MSSPVVMEAAWIVTSTELFERVVVDRDRAGEIGEATAGLGDDEVLDGEGRRGVRRVDGEGAGLGNVEPFEAAGVGLGGGGGHVEPLLLGVVFACARNYMLKSLRAQVISSTLLSWIQF